MDGTKSGQPLMGKYMQKIFFLLIVLFFFPACNPFAPALSNADQPVSQILTEQKTPQDVMTNFAYAYNFKDSLVYSDLLDSSFIFVSKNYATDPVTDIIWGRDTDLKTTVGLFRHFQTLSLIWGGTIRQAYLTIDSNSVELKQVFQLTLDGGREIPTLNGEALFILRRSTGGIWRINRWDDLSTY